MAMTAGARTHAGYRLCNHTSYVIYSAIGFQAGSEMFTQGWSRIPPGFCATPITDALKSATYYIYARSADAHAGAVHAWGGKVNLCAKAADFSLHTSIAIPGCSDPDGYRLPFAAVEVRGHADWTTNFTEARVFANPAATQRAGIQRLLADNGYGVGAADASAGRKPMRRSRRSARGSRSRPMRASRICSRRSKTTPGKPRRPKVTPCATTPPNRCSPPSD